MSFTQLTIRYKLLLILSLSLFLSIPALFAQPVDNERCQANPTTKYKWFHNKSAGEVNTLRAGGYRLIDLDIVDKSPYRFSGTMVRNTGDHQKADGWWYGLTSPQVQDTADKYDLRAINIVVYRVNGNKRLAAVFVKNTGDQYAKWWYYTDRSYQFLLDKAEEKGARISDLDTYTVNGTRYYSAILIRNTGKNYKAWWTANNATAQELLDFCNQKNARVVDWERKSDNNYCAVIERTNHEDFQDQFVLWRGEKLENVTEVARHFGARIVDIEPYMKNNKRYFDLVMLDNTNALTTRVGNILRNNIGGNIAPYNDDDSKRGHTVGLRLEEVGGGTKASLQDTRKFYPASTIKVQEYWYIYRSLLQNDPNAAATLNNTSWGVCQNITNYSNNSNASVGCNTQQTLRTTLRQMMRQSDNEATNAIQDYAGNGNASNGRILMNNLAYNLLDWSNKSALKHKLNCGNVTNTNPNILILKDLNKLYEKVFSDPSALNPTLENLFIQNMLNHNNGFLSDQLDIVIQNEGGKLGLTNDEIDDFIDGIRMVYKAGNIGDGYHSIGGWIELPYYCGLNSKQFVFSTFWDRATTRDNQNTGTKLSIRTVAAELLRDEIRNAMSSCRIMGFVLHSATFNPIPGASAELEKLNPATGGFDPVRPASANMKPAVNPATASREGAYGWAIPQRGTYRVKATAPGFRPAYSTTFRVRSNGRMPNNLNVLLDPICPTAFQVTTCPDQYITPSYEGRSVAQIKAKATGGQKPYTFAWSNGVNEKKILVDPTQTTTYAVVATDANGCQATAIHTVNVQEITCRLAAGEPAVEMCFFDGRSYQTQCIPLGDVALNLSTGNWTLGNCTLGLDFSGGDCGNPQGLPNGTNFRQAELTAEFEANLIAFPNPFTETTQVEFQLNAPMTVSLEVFNANGQRIKVLREPTYTDAGTFKMTFDAQDLAAGMYIIVMKGDAGFAKSVKVVKTH